MPTVTAASSVPKAATAVDRPVASDELDELDPDLRRIADLQGFEGKTGQTMLVVGDGSAPVEVLVGIGPRADVGPNALRKAGAALARAVAKHRVIATNLASEVDDDGRAAAIAAVVEGARLASYRYRVFKTEDKKVKLEKITVVRKGRGVKADVEKAAAVADAVALARDLANEPGGSLTPEVFASRAKEVGTAAGLKVTVWDERKIATEKLGGVLAVNQGSDNPPRFVKLEYRPTKPQGRLALVGKGITFDSGGLSLKTAVGMATMKVDMSGGAAVLAAMSTLPTLGPAVAVDGYIPLTDNMTGGDAQRPGDVFTARNGKTVEVLNTDAEGRLILADALSLASEDEPDAIIDIATLTGSASAALGTSYAALMATDDDLAAAIEGASKRTGEKVWRLPLPSEYRSQLDSTVADLKNIGSGPFGGALLAGLFLSEFVDDDVPWAHIDLGMAAMSESERGLITKGATGFGVRLLVDTVVNWGS